MNNIVKEKGEKPTLLHKNTQLIHANSQQIEDLSESNNNII